ncbi:hypothetical protein P12x_003039 [Tundrisphaera lichenicola]|uniref:hypothetical protein n=1 Tax=Tundrisphaera lichenicola TaxID=2029860 RepID=UPI003EB96A11
MPRRYAVLLLVGLVGCSGGKSTEELIAEDVKARGLIKPPPQATPAPAASEFKPYDSPDGRFRVNFPGEPRFVDHGPSKPEHRTGMQSYIVLRQPRQYSILRAENEEAPEPAAELQRLSDNYLRRSLDGEITSSEDLSVGGRPAREIVVADIEKTRRARFVVDGKDVYQVTVDVPEGEAGDETDKAFVASFELLKK